jgi:hypothetical protein
VAVALQELPPQVLVALLVVKAAVVRRVVQLEAQQVLAQVQPQEKSPEAL